jgi:hypothetical protein
MSWKFTASSSGFSIPGDWGSLLGIITLRKPIDEIPDFVAVAIWNPRFSRDFEFFQNITLPFLWGFLGEYRVFKDHSSRF